MREVVQPMRSARDPGSGRRGRPMAQSHTDPTFYPSARVAMDAPREQLAYVVTLNTENAGRPDALCAMDVDAGSPTYAQGVGRRDMPNPRHALDHFAWNACS